VGYGFFAAIRDTHSHAVNARKPLRAAISAAPHGFDIHIGSVWRSFRDQQRTL